jgi:outer membrane protein TolC
LHTYYSAVNDTLLDVRTGYYDVLLAEQQITVREAEVKLLSGELENTRKRLQAGTVPQFDVLRAEVRVANAQPRLIAARNAYRDAKTKLATLLGYDIPVNIGEDIPMSLTDKLHSEPASVQLPAAIAQALQRRPELAALERDLNLRRERVRLAKAESRPWLNLFAGYDGRNSSFRQDFGSSVSGPIAGVEMTWDIWDGGGARGRVAEAQAYYSKAQVALQDTARKVEQEVRLAYSRLLQAQEVLESQKKVQETAQEALRLAVSRYDAGTGTQLDVLDAQTALTEARVTQVEALRNYLVAQAQVARAIGQDVPESGRTEGKTK